MEKGYFPIKNLRDSSLNEDGQDTAISMRKKKYRRRLDPYEICFITKQNVTDITKASIRALNAIVNQLVYC